MIILKSALRTLLGDHDETIWSDQELQEYLNIGLAWWNLLPPETQYTFADTALLDTTAVLMAATIHITIDLITSLDDDTLYSPHLGVVITEHQYQFYYELFRHAEEQFEQAKTRKWHLSESQPVVWH